jgi:hypothetical protein
MEFNKSGVSFCLRVVIFGKHDKGGDVHKAHLHPPHKVIPVSETTVDLLLECGTTPRHHPAWTAALH